MMTNLSLSLVKMQRCLVLFILPLFHFTFGHEISFLKNCLNNSVPDAFPSSGIHSSGSIVMSHEPESGSWYYPNMNCSVVFSTENQFQILLTFSNISLRNSSMDNLTLSFNDQESEIVLAGQQVCASENCEGLKFVSGDFGNLTMKFISANVTVPSNVTGFKVQYTVFNYVDPRTHACQSKHRYLCENKRCIWYDLVCDGHNNCGDNSDETKCIIPVRNTVWGILVIVIAIIAVVIFVPLFIFLALSGTRSIVKFVHLPNQPTPLESALDCGETSGLLTSSEAAMNAWPGSSYEGSNPVNYGSAKTSEPSTSDNSKQKHSSASVAYTSEENRFL